MRLAQGATLGSYEILALLGAGGMGEVYRARDPRLGREVAIKVLPEELAGDGERIARFEREARSLAALNHPNVATLHGFEAEGGCRFLVMELVEGEDLAARIARGAIPVEEALPLFLQIAEGLEAAHEKGILHRDLKPANVKVDGDGRVKILDFGLAKAMADEPPAAAGGSVGDFTHSPTLTAQATRVGTLLGTAAYMSPEQARGLAADPRADVWAFGCCFYEALTGKRPFAGEDLPETLAAVLKDTPDWSALPVELPRNLAVLVRRCLEKNRRARVQSMGDVRVELQESLAPPAAVAPAAGAALDTPRERGSRWARRSLWLAAALATFVAGLLVAPRGKAGPSSSSSPATRMHLALHDGGRIRYDFRAPPLAISPDGRRIAYEGYDDDGGRIWLLDLGDEGVATPVPGTNSRYGPFFSPDGESLGYLSYVTDSVRVVPLNGGDPRPIVGGLTAANSSATWDGDWIYFSERAGAISRVAAGGGGSPEPVTRPPPTDFHKSPQPLPGGEHVLHSVTRRGQTQSTVALTTIATGEQTVLFEGGFAPSYLPTGHLLVAQEDVLLAMTLDLDTLKVGPPVPVLHGLVTSFGVGYAAYAVSNSGVLVYLSGALERDGWLVRVRPGAAPERLHERPMDFAYSIMGLAVSPDGRRVALSRKEGDLWTFDLESGDLDARVTTETGLERRPIWGPGDGMLTFGSIQAERSGLYSRRADGQGPVEPLVADSEAQKLPTSWSPKNERLLYQQRDPATQSDLWILPAGRPEAAEVFLRTDFNEESAVFSPDGRWVAYISDETTRWEVYVTSYPDRDIKRRVSREGGLFPRWGPDSQRLFFSWSDRVMVVEATDSRWTPSLPEPFVEGIERSNWDVAPDGRSIIALEPRPPMRLHMVQNWFSELERLVPVE